MFDLLFWDVLILPAQKIRNSHKMLNILVVSKLMFRFDF